MKTSLFFCTALFALGVLVISYAAAQTPNRVRGLERSAELLQRGETKIQVPTFKKDATSAQKAAQVRQLDRVVRRIRADEDAKLTPGVRDGLKHWEKLNPQERESVLQGLPPKGEAANTWAVAVVAAAALAYDMYKNSVKADLETRTIQPHELDLMKAQPRLKQQLEGIDLDPGALFPGKGLPGRQLR
jgi:hypothetical protein